MHAWLRHVPEERYRDSLQRRLEGTCLWILEEPRFLEWMAPGFSSGVKILWIHGPAGFGKTILCANIVHHLTETLKPPTAHFFFSSEAASRDDPFLAVRSWVSQIISSHDGAFRITFQRLEGDTDPSATRHTVMSIFEALVRLVPGCTLVLDGLDECTTIDGSATNSVVTFLETIIKAIAGTETRLLVVSRFLADIRHALQVDDLANLSEYKLRPEDVQPDISAYSRDVVDSKLRHRNPALRSSLSDTMAERCEGQFLWLKLQGESLRRGMSKKQLEDTVKDTPANLDHIYEHSWNKITRLKDGDKNRAFALLRWAAFAERPIRIDEVVEAVLVEESQDCDAEDLCDEIDKDYVDTEVIGLCSSFLEARTDPEDPAPSRLTLHLPHFTVREYLAGRLPTPGWIRSGLLELSTEMLHHALLAQVCLRYINLPATWSVPLTTTDVPAGTRFRVYASRCWHHHVASGVRDEASLMELALRFCDMDNANWASWRALQEGQDKPTPESQEPVETSEMNKLKGRVYYALQLGLSDLTMHLLQTKRYRPEELTFWGLSPFWLACSSGILPIVQEFVWGQGADVNCSDVAGWTPLSSAAKNGRTEVAKFLIDEGANVQRTNNAGESPLFEASCNGHVEVVRLLLENNAAIVPTGTENGPSAMAAACRNGHVEIVRLLIDRGADIKAADADGSTRLFAAAAGGRLQVLKLLLEKGADHSVVNRFGWTPFVVATYNDHLEAAELLLDHGADMEVVDIEGWTSLVLAARLGHLNLVKMLADRKADITVANFAGRTSIHSAAAFGHAEVVKFLIEKGADFDHMCKEGLTATHAAVIEGHAEVVMILLAAGGEVSRRDVLGNIPIWSAARKGDLEVAKLLLAEGTDVNTPNNYGYTALHAAVLGGNLEIFKLVLEHGGDVSATSTQGFTLAHLAADNGRVEVLKLLLDMDEAEDMMLAPSYAGDTPLMLAAASNHAEAARLLVTGKDVVSRANNQGFVPVHWAALSGDVGLMELLLENGADMHARSTVGWTAISITARHGHLEVVKLLLDKKVDMALLNKGVYPPIHMAARGGHLDVVELFLEHGADITVHGHSGGVPLSLAASNGHVAIVKLLLDKTCDINQPDQLGRTPLFAAARTGRLQAVQALREAGADTTIADWSGATPLMAAVRCKYLEVARYLLGGGGTPDEKDAAGRDLLWWARHNSDEPMEQLLLGNDVAPGPPESTDAPNCAFCDVCSRDVPDSSGHRCDLCGRLAFYLCAECYKAGVGCYNPAHGFFPKKLVSAETI